jgi:hypothetical protein
MCSGVAPSLRSETVDCKSSFQYHFYWKFFQLTMAHHLSPSAASFQSQDSLDDHLNSLTDSFPEFEENPTAVTDSVALEAAPVGLRPRAELMVTQEPCSQVANSQATTTKGKRNRFKYANRCILADYCLFLLLEHTQSWKMFDPQTWDTRRIRGRIAKCGNMKDKPYVLQWDSTDTASFEKEWLRTELPVSDFTKELLREAAHCFDNEHNVAGAARKRTHDDNNSGDEADNEDFTTPRRRPRGTMNTPTTAERAQAAANIATCGRSMGSVSELTNPSGITMTNSASTGVSTRHTRTLTETVDSDSDSEGDELPICDADDIYRIRPHDPLDDDVSEDLPEDNSEDEDSDDTVDPTLPEDSRTLYQKVSAVIWKFEAVEPTAGTKLIRPRKPMYEGPTGLKPRVETYWSTPLQCFQHVGGCDYDALVHYTRNSNNYFHEMIKPTLGRNLRYHSLKWKNIKVQETAVFIGILLRMSLSPMDYGGYAAAFSEEDQCIRFSDDNDPITLVGTASFIRKYMSLNRFRQIRGCFHPEDKKQGLGGDKCYQLRYAINKFNTAARETFYNPRDVCFDEGGTGCRSRYCPCRQYNKDKPKKYRVDFFLLSCSRTYSILHLDVYQGKNGNNIGVNKAIQDFPTTQRAVLNALYSRKFHQETGGYRHLAADNRYACPELCVAAREKFSCYISGTTRTKRKGWDKAIMNLSSVRKNELSQGQCNLAYDYQNEILIGQWHDNKIVNFCSSANDIGLGTVKRCSGSTRDEYPCPIGLIMYQKNMFGVDKGDQMRDHGAGFSNHVHFKKWYKRVFLAILDCGLLNAYNAWNAAASSSRLGRRKLQRHEFYAIIAQSLLDFVDPNEEDNGGATKAAPTAALHPTVATPRILHQESFGNHQPIMGKKGGSSHRCAICLLEKTWLHSTSNLKNGVVCCSECGIWAHHCHLNDKLEIHKMEEFKGLTCFDILHSIPGKEIWRATATNNQKKYTVHRNHPLVTRLRAAHNLAPLRSGNTKKTTHSDNDVRYHFACVLVFLTVPTWHTQILCIHQFPRDTSP